MKSELFKVFFSAASLICCLSLPSISTAQEVQSCSAKLFELGCSTGATGYSQDQASQNGQLVYSYYEHQWRNSGTQGNPILPIPGIPGYTCGHGRSKLNLTIYGPQASEFFTSLNLPEHKQTEYPFTVYKRLNIDGTTEGRYKEANISCEILRASSGAVCHVTVPSVPLSQVVDKVYPCPFESKVRLMTGQVVGDQAERLSAAIGGGRLSANYSDGSHKIVCSNDARFKSRCVVTVEINE